MPYACSRMPGPGLTLETLDASPPLQAQGPGPASSLRSGGPGLAPSLRPGVLAQVPSPPGPAKSLSLETSIPAFLLPEAQDPWPQPFPQTWPWSPALTCSSRSLWALGYCGHHSSGWPRYGRGTSCRHSQRWKPRAGLGETDTQAAQGWMISEGRTARQLDRNSKICGCPETHGMKRSGAHCVLRWVQTLSRKAV